MRSQYLKISEVMVRSVTIDLEVDGIKNKTEPINDLVGLLDQAGLLINKEEYIQSVYKRETYYLL